MIDAIRQFQISSPMTALVAICGSVRWWYFGDLSTGTCSLIADARKEDRPCRVGNTLCQTVILDHVQNHQLLNADDSEPLDDLGAFLMRKVMTFVSNTLVNARDLLLAFVILFTAFLKLAQLSLRLGKFLLFGSKETRIGNLLIAAESSEIKQISIDSYLFSTFRQGFRCYFRSEDRKPFPAGSTLDLTGFDLAFQRSMQHDLNVANLAQGQSCVHYLSTAIVSLRISETLILKAILEAGKSGFLTILDSLKEALESFVQASQCGLQDLRIYPFQLSAGLFDLRQLVLLLAIADRYAVALIGISALLQSGIMQLSAYVQRGLKECFLFVGWVDSVFERFLHLSLSLCFNVSLDYFQRCPANCYDKVRWTPKMSFPESVFQCRKLFEQSTCRYSFEAIDQFRELMRGLGFHNNVDMINFRLHGNQVAITITNQNSKNFFQSIANFSGQYRAAIFHAPNNMIREQIDRMTAAFKFIFHSLRIPKTNYENNGFIYYLCGFSIMQPRAAFIPDQDKAVWSGTSAGEC